ncbi:MULTISPECIES: DivIVA domain-containing protein [unclassified Nocardiopsis]
MTSPGFDVVLRGYHRGQVDGFLSELADAAEARETRG